MDTSKSIVELFKQTLAGDDEDDLAGEALQKLQNLNTTEVFHLAAEYCNSPVPVNRERGLEVLGSLGAGHPMPERPHFDECVSIAIRHLADEDPKVVNSAAWALKQLGGEQAVTALIQMRGNEDSDVRHAVACGIVGSPHPAAIQTLIDLMEDQDDDVRDWATFGLGTISK